MLFNSLIFLVFGAAFFALWPLMRRNDNARWIYLVASSFFFYGWWNWRFLFLILAIGLVDFLAGMAIGRHPDRKKIFLVASIASNVVLLAAFKYTGFFAQNIDGLLGLVGIEAGLRPLVPSFLLLMPVGISFYTFQSMSYTIDVYRGNLKPTRSFLHFMSYISLFPQLVAGPIVRGRDLLPQLAQWQGTDEEARWQGLRLIVHGYFLKVVIADNLAPAVNHAFEMVGAEQSCIFWWVAVTMFAFQIYCDFAGYSSIALGLGKWMGYDFGANFNHPYGSRSLREFWGRWHISLSTWFRDYVYVPLGGSRRGAWRTHVNQWITMLISGLWHGAAWTFVLWAAVHSAFLSIERLTRWPERLRRLPLGGPLCTALVLVQVLVAWVFFRAQSASDAFTILSRMFHPIQWSLSISRQSLFALALGIAYEAYFLLGLSNVRLPLGRLRPLVDSLAMAAMIAACVFLRGPGSDFIYFQF